MWQTRTQSLLIGFGGERRLDTRMSFGARGVTGRVEGKIATGRTRLIEGNINPKKVQCFLGLIH